MLKITIEGIVRQNSECKSNNELGKFWNLVSYLRQNGDVHNEADYRIVYTNKFACNKPSTTYPEYIGMKNSVRFKNISKGHSHIDSLLICGDITAVLVFLRYDIEIPFDYDMLNTHYNITLEVADSTEPDEFDDKRKTT